MAQIGGEATAARGCGMGMERVGALLMQVGQLPAPEKPDVYVVLNGERASAKGLALVERLRNELPRRRFEMNLGGGNFKTQFRRADRSAAPLALVVGDEELARGGVGVEPLRQGPGQTHVPSHHV